MYQECIMDVSWMDISMYHLKVAASLCSASTLASSPFCLSRTASNAPGGEIEYLSHVTDLFAILDVSRMHHVTDLFAILAGLFVQHTLYGIVLAANLQQKSHV